MINYRENGRKSKAVHQGKFCMSGCSKREGLHDEKITHEISGTMLKRQSLFLSVCRLWYGKKGNAGYGNADRITNGNNHVSDAGRFGGIRNCCGTGGKYFG